MLTDGEIETSLTNIKNERRSDYQDHVPTVGQALSRTDGRVFFSPVSCLHIDNDSAHPKMAAQWEDK